MNHCFLFILTVNKQTYFFKKKSPVGSSGTGNKREGLFNWKSSGKQGPPFKRLNRPLTPGAPVPAGPDGSRTMGPAGRRVALQVLQRRESAM